MANEKNLIPMDRRSKSEARSNGRKGGIESGKTRRRKANFRKALEELFATPVNIPEWKEKLESQGIENSYQMAILLAQLEEALNGSTPAARFLAEYSGQSKEPEYMEQNRKADTALKEAHRQAVTGENNTSDNDMVLDFIQAMRNEDSGDGSAEQ